MRLDHTLTHAYAPQAIFCCCSVCGARTHILSSIFVLFDKMRSRVLCCTTCRLSWILFLFFFFLFGYDTPTNRQSSACGWLFRQNGNFIGVQCCCVDKNDLSRGKNQLTHTPKYDVNDYYYFSSTVFQRIQRVQCTMYEMRFRAFFFFVQSSLFPNSSVSFRHLRNCLCVEININISIFSFSLAFFCCFGLVWCHKFMSDCYIFYVDLYIFTFYNKREYLRAIIVDIKYFHTYLFHSFLVIVFALSWRFSCSTDSTQENKKRHFVFFRQFSSVLFVFPLSPYLCVFFFPFPDVCVFVFGLEYACFNASPTMNDVPSNKFELSYLYFSGTFRSRFGIYSFVIFLFHTHCLKVIHNCCLDGMGCNDELNATKQKLIDRFILLPHFKVELEREKSQLIQRNQSISKLDSQTTYNDQCLKF